MDGFLSAFSSWPLWIKLGVIFAAVLFAGWILANLFASAPQDWEKMDEEERAEIDAALRALTPSQSLQIDAAIDAGRKIMAIRFLRQYTGLGLKQAKNGVERRMRRRDLTDRP